MSRGFREEDDSRVASSYAEFTDELREKYKARLAYEMEVIKSTGFASYFLIVADFIGYAKSHDIPVGPGRGSAAGSLVAFCLDITNVDPIKYDLLFERFLNPERVSMPDIDVDFCFEKRERVIEYVTNKYGKDNVAQIITFGTMKSKAAVRDVGRALGIPYANVDQIAKLIPATLDISIEQAMAEEPRLRELYREGRDRQGADRQRDGARAACAPRVHPRGRDRHIEQAAHGIRAPLPRPEG